MKHQTDEDEVHLEDEIDWDDEVVIHESSQGGPWPCF